MLCDDVCSSDWERCEENSEMVWRLVDDACGRAPVWLLAWTGCEVDRDDGGATVR